MKEQFNNAIFNNAVFNIADSATLAILAIIADFAAIAIALGALFVTFRQMRVQSDQMSVQRRHNKLSVKPFLRVGYESTWGGKKADYKITLINGGLGPAFISEFMVLRNDKPCNFNEETELLFGSRITEKYLTRLRKDFAIAPNTKVDLLSVKYPITSYQDVISFTAEVRTFAFTVKYSSAYGDESDYDSRKN